MKWVIGIVLLLVVVCGGLCAAGGGYFYWMTRNGSALALPDYLIAPTEADAAVTADPASGKVGVESCDAYIERMTACLGTMDPVSKAAMETGFTQTADAWRAAAATPEGKAGLEMGCKAALDSIPASCSGAAAQTPTDAAVVPAEPGTGGSENAPADPKQGDSISPAGGPGAAGSGSAAAGQNGAGATSTGSSPATAAKSGSTPPAASTPPATSGGTKPATTTTPPSTTKPTTSTPPPAGTKAGTTTPPAGTKAGTSTTPPSTSTTGKPSSSRPPVSDDEPIAPPTASGDSKVAIGFVLPSGGKWDELVVGVDGSSLGKRPLRTRVTPGSHTFTFKADGIDLTCPIDVGSSGRTIILDQKKKSCPSKAG